MDPIIQIANVIQLHGAKEVMARNIFCLNSCAPIGHAEVGDSLHICLLIVCLWSTTTYKKVIIQFPSERIALLSALIKRDFSRCIAMKKRRICWRHGRILCVS